MGSREAPEFVGVLEAARLLKCTKRAIHVYVRNGTLRPLRVEGGIRFRATDLLGLQEARSRTDLTLLEVASIALQARAIARFNEQRLEELHLALGIPSTTLDRTPAGVVGLHAEAVRPLLAEDLRRHDFIYFWASSFVAMDEDYLALVARHVGSREPWRIFLDLASQLLAQSPDMATTAIELRQAFAALEAARRSLRHVAYFYCTRAESQETANQLFPEKPSPVDTLLAILSSR